MWLTGFHQDRVQAVNSGGPPVPAYVGGEKYGVLLLLLLVCDHWGRCKEGRETLTA